VLDPTQFRNLVLGYKLEKNLKLLDKIKEKTIQGPRIEYKIVSAKLKLF
jgi:hypothetical protein